jgi:hypothetical protein
VPTDSFGLPNLLTAAATDAPSWADAWQAWGSVIAAGAAVLTLLAAIAAAIVAWGQLRESRDLRREQAQAYVVAYAEALDRISPTLVDVVIENLGTTGARNVTVTSTPPLQRTGTQGAYRDVILPTSIPFLAPRQQVRTHWDRTVERSRDQTLPHRHEVAVTYIDTFGKQHREVFVLDWTVFKDRMFTAEKTIHHAAKSLAEIAQALKGRQS